MRFHQGVQACAQAVVPTTVIRVTRQARARPALLVHLLLGELLQIGPRVPHAPWAVDATAQASRVCVYADHTPGAEQRSALCVDLIICMRGARGWDLVLHVPPVRSRRATIYRHGQLALYVPRVLRVMERATLSRARRESTAKPRAARAPFAVLTTCSVAQVVPAPVHGAPLALLPRGAPR